MQHKICIYIFCILSTTTPTKCNNDNNNKRHLKIKKQQGIAKHFPQKPPYNNAIVCTHTLSLTHTHPDPSALIITHFDLYPLYGKHLHSHTNTGNKQQFDILDLLMPDTVNSFSLVPFCLCYCCCRCRSC